jgi:hypothetical protein
MSNPRLSSSAKICGGTTRRIAWVCLAIPEQVAYRNLLRPGPEAVTPDISAQHARNSHDATNPTAYMPGGLEYRNAWHDLLTRKAPNRAGPVGGVSAATFTMNPRRYV